MNSPSHPGEIIKHDCLEAFGLSVTDAANHLGVARHTLSRLLNGRAGVSPEMAIRLEKAGWSNAEFWLRLQASYDLADARTRADDIDVVRFEPA
jgi:addiction module HigA family antidote